MNPQANFESLLKPHQEVAYRYAFRLTGNADAAMDLLQDAVLLAYKAIESFQPESNFRAWFLRILTNRFYRVSQQKSDTRRSRSTMRQICTCTIRRCASGIRWTETIRPPQFSRKSIKKPFAMPLTDCLMIIAPSPSCII